MSVDDFERPGNAAIAPIELPQPEPDVSLWWVALAADDDAFAHLSSWLSTAEHARAARFGRDALRRRYAIGRASLRWVLGRRLGVPPGQVPIVRGERGRPHLEGRADLDFNVSHTEGVALIGVARGARIGVDVEHAAREVSADGLARKFLTAAERDSLVSLDERERRVRFLRYWTCKEAMSKATGDGLSAPFREIEVHFDSALALVAGPKPYEPERWRLHMAAVPDGYLGTVALWSKK